MQQQNAFTVKFPGRTRVLLTKIKVCLPVTPDGLKDSRLDLKEYLAIWDTGATNSAITKKVADDLGLKPTGLTEVRHAKGKSDTNTYLVNIALPNNVMFGQLRVTEAELIADANLPEDNKPQVLVGMDIISAGDFAVTNFEGKTVFSFRVPSAREIDFIPESNRNNLGETRNERRARERQLRKQGLM